MLHFTDRLRILVARVFRYEFWPYYVFYFPALIYGFYLALRSGSLTYFTAANPVMKYSGAFGMSKTAILEAIEQAYRPRMLQCIFPFQTNAIYQELDKQKIEFPVVIKPEIGERGINVEKINNRDEFENYVKTKTENLIIQEFIGFKYEIGVLYYRFPNQKTGHISSVVKRNFLAVTGDGKSTIIQLIKKDIRALMRLKFLIKKYGEQLNVVLPDGEERLLEPIGNHNRGTAFLNANHMINNDLIQVFDTISKNIHGFFYGRYDVKYKSLVDLYQGKNIKILELNGVNSEPAHIYDPGYSLFNAYGDVFKHMRIIRKISKYNHKNGEPYVSFGLFFKAMRKHMGKNK